MVGAAADPELVGTAVTIKPVRIVITPERIVGVRASGILDAVKVIGLVLVPPVGVPAGGFNKGPCPARRFRMVVGDPHCRLSGRQVDMNSWLKVKLIRRDGEVPPVVLIYVVKVGYGVVAVATKDDVIACTGFDIVIASPGPNCVWCVVCVDVIRTVGPLEKVQPVGALDSRHGRALLLLASRSQGTGLTGAPPSSDVLDTTRPELVL